MRRLSTTALLAWTLAGVVLCMAFVALGTWQIERRAWKLALIARVEQRVHAAPGAAPAQDAWPRVTAESDEYRHVLVSGVFLNDRETLVQANTDLGPGFWVLTPLRNEEGSCIIVNRGFVPPEQRDPAARADTTLQGEQVVSGLLRITEPGGGFLRRNDPAADRWYSRDVSAIGKARVLTGASEAPCTQLAPYFIDADRGKSADRGDVVYGPVGGLTIVSFYNSHLAYVITWYTLALMVAAAVIFLWRTERRSRTPTHEADTYPDGDD